uniref:Uncharacterized protein n=1 Tax=Oryza punctata TaxID=4537 RepID=A0A0E0LRZ2_ORYPU
MSYYWGFLVMLVGVGGAHALGSYGPLVGLLGVLAGSGLIFAGVKAKTTATTGNTVVSLTSSTARYLRCHNLAMLGLFTAGASVMAHVAGAGGPAISILLFVMLLFGVALVNLGVLHEN